MKDEDVRFLDACGDVMRNDYGMVNLVFQNTSIPSQQADGVHLPFSGLLHGGNDVGRVPRCGNTDEHVARIAQRLHLSGKDLFETKVIADGRDIGCVRSQGNAGQRPPVLLKTAHEFRRKMLRIGG